MEKEEKTSATEKEKKEWSIKEEGHLNPNNIIFTEKIKKMVDEIKDSGPKEIEDDPGLLVCTICNTGSNPSGETDKFGDIHIGYCAGCGDWGEFVYESEM